MDQTRPRGRRAAYPFVVLEVRDPPILSSAYGMLTVTVVIGVGTVSTTGGGTATVVVTTGVWTVAIVVGRVGVVRANVGNGSVGLPAAVFDEPAPPGRVPAVG